jgi:hypothetical protein
MLMPRLDTARQIANIKYNGAKTVGQIQKEQSDFVIEQTWDDDLQSRICYIYDYAHDDQPDINKGMSYKNTTKTRIDAKFIVDSYGSLDKDQIPYKIMFRPSEKLSFSPSDEMYYFETDYRKKYDIEYPVGLMIDIPNDKGIYYKWLVVDYEEANQFVKYSVLPCDYRLQWIAIENGKKYKRQLWCCTRSANSYTSGLYKSIRIVRLFGKPRGCIPLNCWDSLKVGYATA